jgi:hypothetical protein
MTDAYTKAVFTVIAFALMVLAVRPIIEPGRVAAQGPSIAQRLNKLEHNADVMRSAGNLNAHRTNVRFSRAGWGVDVVLVDVDASGVMGPRSELAIQPFEPPNPF